MGISGAAHGWVGGQKGPPPQKSVTHIYNDETWHSYTLPKKYVNHVTSGNQQILLYQEIQI